MPQLWNLPYQRNPLFTGREELLTQLYHRFQERVADPTLALTGLGGIGKTQVAVEYASRHQKDYRLILWLNASSLGNAAGKGQFFVGFKSWLYHERNWLLVLDQIEDLSLIDLIVPPKRSGDHVLITTRARATGTYADVLPVEPMSTDAGALFLLRRTGLLPAEATIDQAPAAEVSLAKAIAHKLDGLPLALDQAGASLKETRCGLATYQDLSPQEQTALLSRRGQMVDACHPDSLGETIEQICQRLDPPALELLRLFAFCFPDAPDELAGGHLALNRPLRALAADPLALDEARAELLRFSLVHPNPHTTMLSMYRIVRDIIISTLTTRQQRAYERMAASLSP